MKQILEIQLINLMQAYTETNQQDGKIDEQTNKKQTHMLLGMAPEWIE